VVKIGKVNTWSFHLSQFHWDLFHKVVVLAGNCCNVPIANQCCGISVLHVKGTENHVGKAQNSRSRKPQAWLGADGAMDQFWQVLVRRN